MGTNNSLGGGLIFENFIVNSNLVLSDGYYQLLVDTSSSRNITLPQPSVGRTFKIKDMSGLAGTNNITLIRNGSEQIDGIASSRVFSADWGVWEITSDGTNWLITSKGNTVKKYFTSNDTWVAPSGITEIFIIASGGGGGGSGGPKVSSAASFISGGAGGGGALEVNGYVSIVPNTSYGISIGTGGSGSAGSSNDTITVGGNGGNTTFGSLFTAAGAGGAQGVIATLISAGCGAQGGLSVVGNSSETTNNANKYSSGPNFGGAGKYQAPGATYSAQPGFNSSQGFNGGSVGSTSGSTIYFGGGGGGAGSKNNGASGGDGSDTNTATNGSNASNNSGAGGGGGGSANTGNGGNGGNGGSGYMYIIYVD